MNQTSTQPAHTQNMNAMMDDQQYIELLEGMLETARDSNAMYKRLLDYAEQGQQTAIAERDQAIREKGQISLRREAKYMNGESQLSKENKKYKEILGEGGNWMRVDCIPWLQEFFPDYDLKDVKRVVGIQLTKWCEEQDCYRIRKVPHGLYNLVNAYPAKAIKEYHQFLTNSHLEKAQYEWLLRAHNRVS